MTDASTRPADPSLSASSEEHATELLVPVHDGMTTPWALAERVRRSPDGGLIARKSPLGRRWREMSASAFRTQVREVAAGLVARGLQPGDAIGIMSHTSYEWTLLDFAAWEAGLVVVPVYETSSAEQAQWILTDAGVRLIVVENEAMASMVGALTSTVPELESLQVLCVEREDVLGLIKAGRGVDAGELDRRSAALTSQSLATIVYTSGTTGRPKGVELSHGNLVHLCVNVCPHVPEVLGGDEVRFLLFLPLAHVLGRFVEIAVVCSRAGVLGHVPVISSTTWAPSGPPRSWPSPGSSRRSITPPMPRRPVPSRRSSAWRPRPRSRTPEPWTPLRARRADSGLSAPPSTSSSSPPCAPCWEGGSRTSSPGAGLWASAWDTSTAAPESPSWRATA